MGAVGQEATFDIAAWIVDNRCKATGRPVVVRWGEVMPAVGGGPSPEQWKKMSKADKTVYWIFICAVVAFIGFLVLKKLSS